MTPCHITAPALTTDRPAYGASIVTSESVSDRSPVAVAASRRDWTTSSQSASLGSSSSTCSVKAASISATLSGRWAPSHITAASARTVATPSSTP